MIALDLAPPAAQSWGVAKPTKLTPKRKAKFLDALRANCNVADAVKSIGMNRCYLYQVRDANPEFAAAWRDAIEDGIEALELVVRKRALETSDVLAMFLLKAHRPDVYRERFDHNMTGGQTITINSEILARGRAKIAAHSAESSTNGNGSNGSRNGHDD